MPKLIRLYIVSVGIGLALSAAFLALLRWQDVARSRHLIWQSDMRWTAVAMMIVMNGVVFSGVQSGIAVMRLVDQSTGPTGGTRAWQASRVPAPVRSAAK